MLGDLNGLRALATLAGGTGDHFLCLSVWLDFMVSSLLGVLLRRGSIVDLAPNLFVLTKVFVIDTERALFSLYYIN